MSPLVSTICQFWSSSIGKKVVVALTGIVLVGFLAGHLAGNLLVYVGREATNDYAEFLMHLLHGAGIWIARAVLLTCFVLHIVATIQLTRSNRAARADAYEVKTSVRTTLSARVMIWSGLTILAFVIFHLLHFTVRIDQGLADLRDPLVDRHDTYGMVVRGFQNVPVSLFYIVALTLLCSHLSHGVASIFQTLGLRSKKTRGAIKVFSWIYAAIIWLGFISIPISIMLGLVHFD